MVAQELCNKVPETLKTFVMQQNFEKATATVLGIVTYLHGSPVDLSNSTEVKERKEVRSRRRVFISAFLGVQYAHKR